MHSHDAPPAPDNALRALEEKLGIALPPALRGCYATANGGRFGDPQRRDAEWQLHPVRDSSDRKQLKRTAEDILHFTQIALRNTHFPRHGLSIAHDYTMSRQLLVLRDEATGVIGDEIFLFEAHTARWSAPYASDLRAAMAQQRIPETVQPDPSRALPVFRYHADPFASGVMRAASDTCECCGQATGYIYDGSFYAVGDASQFCPWCIADGSAAAKFDGEFNDADSVGMGEVALPPAVVDEVSRRTPSFFSYQQEQWWAHCNDAGCFLGEIEHVDRALLASESARAFKQDMQAQEQLPTEAEWQWLLATPSRERHAAVYVFRCLHCGTLGGYSDCT
ncbi:CbrC family protein [Variovorax sp. 38R]|uniref:CbrC family protein n=1 Tax=Variovorax sp. 38R TaxID=2774875 RepID=UPI00177B446C|nr:CbrC family protein [Variovorax sp. 38R]QOF80833.1 CbrC family protein [Variovorax sp. 38R]